MIPLKLETLLKGSVVEQDRVEYKRGWNPADTVHTICAFANDFPNVNGGYIVIGVESKNGIPILPPCGIPKDQLDKVQQEIFQYCNMIEPRYVPKMEVVDYRDSGTFLLYLRCSAGDGGPYQAPVDVYSGKKDGKKADRTMRYWIRGGSVTASAQQDEIELSEKQCTGITKILNALESNGSPPPVFETDIERHYLIVTIRQHEGFSISEQINVQDNVLDNVQDIPVDNVRENKVDVRRNKIIELLMISGETTMYEIAIALNVSTKTIQRDLEMLRKQKKIIRIGSDTSGYWKVKEPDGL